MADKAVTLSTRKFMTNLLLSRKQFVIDVLQSSSRSCQYFQGRVEGKISYDVNDQNSILSSSSILIFGGGKSTGLDGLKTVDSAKKYEPKYRLIRNGLATKLEKSRKQLKERKKQS